MSYLINLELSKISDWLPVNKLSLNADKTKFMIFHNHQKVMPTHDIPCVVINNTVVEWVTEFNFLGTDNKWIHELELPFIKDCEQNFSNIAHNETT